MSCHGVFCHKTCHIVFVTPITVHVTTTFASQQCVQCSVTCFFPTSTVKTQYIVESTTKYQQKM